MAAYYKFFSISLYENFYYRTDFIIRFLTSFLQSYTLVAVWFYIMISTKEDIGTVLADNSIKYMVLVSSFTIGFRTLPDNEITKSIQSGDIIRNLLIPVSFPITIFFKSMGNLVGLFFIQVIPIFIFLTLFYGIEWEINFMKLLVLFVGFIVSCYLFFLINLGTDILSFWLYETSYFRYMKSAIIAFFSGSIAPLWFYPEWLLKILDLLPFRQLYYNPISYYLGEINIDNYLIHSGITIFWLLTIQIIIYVLWKKGTKKVVQFGG